MGNDKVQPFKRNVFKTHNKFQTQMMMLTFFPSIIMYLLFICVILIAYPMIYNAVEHSSFMDMERLLVRLLWGIVISMGVVFLVFAVISFMISDKLVGAFGRIIHELDEVIEGRSQKLITARPKDVLASDLLKRINVLVQYYVENKNGKPVS